jgi:hypothetical protein
MIPPPTSHADSSLATSPAERAQAAGVGEQVDLEDLP